LIKFIMIIIGGVLSVFVAYWGSVIVFGNALVKALQRKEVLIIILSIFGVGATIWAIFLFIIWWCRTATKQLDRYDKKFMKKRWRKK